MDDPDSILGDIGVRNTEPSDIGAARTSTGARPADGRGAHLVGVGGPGRPATDAAGLGFQRDDQGRIVDSAGRYQISKLTVSHDAIMNYLLVHPELPMKAVAAAFGVTPGWLYTLVQTDMFKKALSEKQSDLFDVTVADVHQKAAATAAHALDRLNELIPHENDTSTVSDVADKMLQRLGYGARNGVSVSVNQNAQDGHVPHDVLIEAKGVLMQIAQQPREEPLPGSVTVDSDEEAGRQLVQPDQPGSGPGSTEDLSIELQPERGRPGRDTEVDT